MILKAVLIIALCCVVAAWLVTWAKLEDERRERKGADEAVAWNVKKIEEMKWDHISEMLTAENALEREKKLGAEREEEIFRLSVWHNIMQDKLSALLCPTNNHVWKNGVCVKCGRMQK